MTVTILNVLCEGHTEDRFVSEVLKPYLQPFGIVVKHRILMTRRKDGYAGGLISYGKVRNDLVKWIKETSGHSGERNYFTTMFDFYALPNDFPDYSSAIKHRDKYRSVLELESAFGADIPNTNFIPYIQLHEFEALVFCGLDALLYEYPECGKEIESIRDVLSAYNNNPEAIDDSRETAPGKRIEKAIRSKYKYNKPKSGTAVTKAVGIDTLKMKCAHFGEWITKLESLN